jgi:tetratricopeptide (TPR) repeat protein
VRLRRAQLLARLGRLGEADATLAPVANSDVDARLLLASIRQADAHYDASTADYLRVLAELERPRPGVAAWPAARVAIARRRAYEGLVYNASRQARWDEAERACTRAIAALPALAPWFLVRRGLVREEGGDFRGALADLRTALPALPAADRATAASHLRRLSQESPSCLLAPRAVSSPVGPAPRAAQPDASP